MAARDSDTLTLPPVPAAVSMYAPGAVVPSPEWEAWVRETFIEHGAPLHNHEHEHLQFARVAVALTNEVCKDKTAYVLGRAHLGEPMGSDAWQKAVKADWLTRTFGEVPDFYMILYAPHIEDRLEESDPVSVCALVDHELYHMAQDARDGAPLFFKDGRPKWRVRSHDVEEFVGVVRRYGAYSPALRALIEAAERGPTLSPARVRGVCGTCKAAL